MPGGGGLMMVTMEEVADQLRQHEIIRSHMRFLIALLSNLTGQSGQPTAQVSTLNERISLYRWSLYDFQEAVSCHMETDEHIFGTVCDGVTLEILMREHEEIKKQMDSIVSLAQNAIYLKLRRKELNKCASDIVEGANKTCELLSVHMAKEERILMNISATAPS